MLRWFSRRAELAAAGGARLGARVPEPAPLHVQRVLAQHCARPPAQLRPVHAGAAAEGLAGRGTGGGRRGGRRRAARRGHDERTPAHVLPVGHVRHEDLPDGAHVAGRRPLLLESRLPALYAICMRTVTLTLTNCTSLHAHCTAEAEAEAPHSRCILFVCFESQYV